MPGESSVGQETHPVAEVADEQSVARRVVLRVGDGLVALRLGRRRAIGTIGRRSPIGRSATVPVIPAALRRRVVLDVPVAGEVSIRTARSRLITLRPCN